MSRSYRHTPLVPLCGGHHVSEAWDKKTWHARRRMLERVQDARLPPDERYPVSKHAAVNNFCMSKDGHFWWDSRSKVGPGAWHETLRSWYHGYAK